MENPPTEKHKYVCFKMVGVCDKCGQPIYEEATCEEEEFSRSRGGYEWLRKYVEEKLRKSGVIPEDRIHEISGRIVQISLRDGTHKMPDRYVRDGNKWKLVKGRFACIERADWEIEWAIKYPPPPISRSRFSLKAFVKMNNHFFGVFYGRPCSVVQETALLCFLGLG